MCKDHIKLQTSKTYFRLLCLLSSFVLQKKSFVLPTEHYRWNHWVLFSHFKQVTIVGKGKSHQVLSKKDGRTAFGCKLTLHALPHKTLLYSSTTYWVDLNQDKHARTHGRIWSGVSVLLLDFAEVRLAPLFWIKKHPNAILAPLFDLTAPINQSVHTVHREPICHNQKARLHLWVYSLKRADLYSYKMSLNNIQGSFFSKTKQTNYPPRHGSVLNLTDPDRIDWKICLLGLFTMCFRSVATIFFERSVVSIFFLFGIIHNCFTFLMYQKILEELYPCDSVILPPKNRSTWCILFLP